MNCGPMPCKEVDTSVAVASGPRESSKNWVLAATILGSSMEFIDGTVVNVALPNLQSSLGATGAQAQWVVEAYALFISSLLLIGGSLGDRFGLRRMFLCGVILFTIASIWCGLAPGCSEQSRPVERLFPRNRAGSSRRNLVRVCIDHDRFWPCIGRLDGATRLVESRLFPECSGCAGNGLDHPDGDSKSRDESRRKATRLAGSVASNGWPELRHLRTTGVVEPEDAVAPL